MIQKTDSGKCLPSECFAKIPIKILKCYFFMFFNIQNVQFLDVLRAFFCRFMQIEKHSILSF